MKLYNAQSRQIERFPINREPITIYTCSDAPDPIMDLRHAFTYTVIDCLIRYLEFQGHQVTYVRAITDLDRPTLRKTIEAGEEYHTLRHLGTTHFIRTMQTLNLRPPNECFLQQASEHLPAEPLIQDAAVVDFGLHTAKVDYRCPEKTCPILTSEGVVQNFTVCIVSQKSFVPHSSVQGPEGSPDKTFLDMYTCSRQCALVARNLYEDEKICKARDKPVMMHDLLTLYSPDVLRFYLASHHYRRPWSFSMPILIRAAEQTHLVVRAAHVRSGQGRRLDLTPISRYLTAALDEDLNTTGALTVLLYLAEQILAAAAAGRQVQEAQATLRALSHIFGLCLDDPPERRAREGWRRLLPKLAGSAKGVSNPNTIRR